MPETKVLTLDEVAEIEARLERILSSLVFGEPTRGNRYVESVDNDFYFEETADNEFDAFDFLRCSPALCQTVRAAWANEVRLAKEVTELREQLAQTHNDNERLARVIQDIEEREATVCPEDVGFDEYIRTLQRKLETRPRAGYPWTGNEP